MTAGIVTTKYTPARSRFSRDIVEFESPAGFCVVKLGTGTELAADVQHEWHDGLLIEAYFDFPKRRVAYLEMITVLDRWKRGSGQGERLLVAALKWLDHERIPLVGLHASPIVQTGAEYDAALAKLERWYGRHGFVELWRMFPTELRSSVSMARAHPDPGVR